MPERNIWLSSGLKFPGSSVSISPDLNPGIHDIFHNTVALFLQTPVLFYHIISEHFRLKRIIRKYRIEIVISDNRFGLWNRKIKTVYVTHQLRIPFPKILRIFEFTGIMLHRAVIKKYSFCFIPDLPDNTINLSGRLSHDIKFPENAMYIGILSRFTDMVSRPVTHLSVSGTILLFYQDPNLSEAFWSKSLPGYLWIRSLRLCFWEAGLAEILLPANQAI